MEWTMGVHLTDTGRPPFLLLESVLGNIVKSILDYSELNYSVAPELDVRGPWRNRSHPRTTKSCLPALERPGRARA